MPIKPENRALYPKDWKAISRRIRFDRAKNRCERCKAPNGQVIARGIGPDSGTYMVETGEVYSDTTGEYLATMRGSDYVESRFVRVVLTVAHLNHDPADNGDDNLQALCQKCHLAHDREQHQQNARVTRAASKRRKAKEGGQLELTPVSLDTYTEPKATKQVRPAMAATNGADERSQ